MDDTQRNIRTDPMKGSSRLLQNPEIFDLHRHDPAAVIKNFSLDGHILAAEPDFQLQGILFITVVDGQTKQLFFHGAGRQIASQERFQQNPVLSMCFTLRSDLPALPEMSICNAAYLYSPTSHRNLYGCTVKLSYVRICCFATKSESFRTSSSEFYAHRR